MSCKYFEELIALDVSGDLPATDAAQVRAHLNECPACRDFSSELSADLEWLQSAHQEAPDRAALHQVRVGVMRRLESEQSRWTPPFGGIAAYGWRWQWIVTAAAVAIAVGSLAWWSMSLEQPQNAVAVGSQDRDQQRLEIENAPFNRPAEPRVAKADPPVRANENRAAATSSPPAMRKLDPSPIEEAKKNLARSHGYASDAREDPAPASQMASLAPREALPARKPEPSFESLDSERKLEIVTTRLEEPQRPSEEAVMLKIPTSNPNVVVYWLMDEEQQPEEIEENKGD